VNVIWKRKNKEAQPKRQCRLHRVAWWRLHRT